MQWLQRIIRRSNYRATHSHLIDFVSRCVLRSEKHREIYSEVPGIVFYDLDLKVMLKYDRKAAKSKGFEYYLTSTDIFHFSVTVPGGCLNLLGFSWLSCMLTS